MFYVRCIHKTMVLIYRPSIHYIIIIVLCDIIIIIIDFMLRYTVANEYGDISKIDMIDAGEETEDAYNCGWHHFPHRFKTSQRTRDKHYRQVPLLKIYYDH